MARALNNEKRQLILEKAKRLFAEKGFGNTSVSDIARVADVPVGSIYTYFNGKEELIRAIVEEGWENLRARLRDSLAEPSSPETRITLLLDTFLPELLGDVDFINILLSEGISFTRIEEKVDELSGLIADILAPVAQQSASLKGFTSRDMEAALMVYFLGVLDAVRISQVSNLGVTSADVLSFLRRTIQNGLGVSLPE
jgi:AcrR family transcriptional regulator